MLPRLPTVVSLALVSFAAALAAPTARAQLLTFSGRNGENVAYCGPQGGPSAQNNFAAPTATHDVIALNDLGGPTYTASQATSTLVATPAPMGLTLATSGDVSRGPLLVFGTAATADARDLWEFDVAAPARFTFSAAMSGASTQAGAPTVSYLFIPIGAGAQVTLDPGTPPGVQSGALVGPGTLNVTFSGLLSAGRYSLSTQGRVEGVNVWPYSGSYDSQVSLAIDCATPLNYCTAGTTSNGCLAHIQGFGTPSASASSGYALNVTGVEGASLGLIFYGVSGRSATQWGTSSSFVCVKSPTQRTSAQSAGGTAGACDGVFTLDWNQFVAGQPGALGVPFSAGQLVQAQAWFRDAPSSKTTALSDAVEFVFCP